MLLQLHMNFMSIGFVLQLKNSYFCAKIKMNGNKRKTDSPILYSPQRFYMVGNEAYACGYG